MFLRFVALLTAGECERELRGALAARGVVGGCECDDDCRTCLEAQALFRMVKTRNRWMVSKLDALYNFRPQLGLALLTEIVLGHEVRSCIVHTLSVLPRLAYLALDHEFALFVVFFA